MGEGITQFNRALPREVLFSSFSMGYRRARTDRFGAATGRWRDEHSESATELHDS